MAMKTISILMLALLICVTSQLTHGVPDIFFPFGVSQGDTLLHENDDTYSSPISLSTDFIFFASRYSTLYVNTNGLLSFNGGVSTYTPNPFPIANRPVIAVFWGDVDTRNGGDITYREVTDAVLLSDITEVILDVYAARGLGYFSATWGFIATYHNVASFGNINNNARNSFQVVLATDGTHSFTVYNYGTIGWTYGTASSKTDAQVGFDAGDSVNYFAVPASRKPEIANINKASNVATPGRWIFRTDQETIDAGSCGAGELCGGNETEVNGTNVDGGDDQKPEQDGSECHKLGQHDCDCHKPGQNTSDCHSAEQECNVHDNCVDLLSNASSVLKDIAHAMPSKYADLVAELEGVLANDILSFPTISDDALFRVIDDFGDVASSVGCLASRTFGSDCEIRLKSVLGDLNSALEQIEKALSGILEALPDLADVPSTLHPWIHNLARALAARNDILGCFAKNNSF